MFFICESVLSAPDITQVYTRSSSIIKQLLLRFVRDGSPFLVQSNTLVLLVSVTLHRLFITLILLCGKVGILQECEAAVSFVLV